MCKRCFPDIPCVWYTPLRHLLWGSLRTYLVSEVLPKYANYIVYFRHLVSDTPAYLVHHVLSRHTYSPYIPCVWGIPQIYILYEYSPDISCVRGILQTYLVYEEFPRHTLCMRYSPDIHFVWGIPQTYLVYEVFSKHILCMRYSPDIHCVWGIPQTYLVYEVFPRHTSCMRYSPDIPCVWGIPQIYILYEVFPRHILCTRYSPNISCAWGIPQTYLVYEVFPRHTLCMRYSPDIPCVWGIPQARRTWIWCPDWCSWCSRDWPVQTAGDWAPPGVGASRCRPAFPPGTPASPAKHTAGSVSKVSHSKWWLSRISGS